MIRDRDAIGLDEVSRAGGVAGNSMNFTWINVPRGLNARECKRRAIGRRNCAVNSLYG